MRENRQKTRKNTKTRNRARTELKRAPEKARLIREGDFLVADVDLLPKEEAAELVDERTLNILYPER